MHSEFAQLLKQTIHGFKRDMLRPYIGDLEKASTNEIAEYVPGGSTQNR